MFRRRKDGSFSYSERFWVQAIVLLLLIVVIGFNTQRTANRTERISQETIMFAQQTNECLGRVIQVLEQRSRINIENDDISQVERTAIFDLLTEAVNPPPEIAALSPADQRRQDWAEGLIIKYLNVYGAAEQRAAELAEQRRATAYPDPDCGLRLPELS